jgi:Mrp family chromosome partitioning ATPase
MLKYKEVTALGDAAADVLAFAKDLRMLDTLLRDPARAGVVVVTLQQAVVVPETERLAGEIRRLGVPVSGVVVNRATSAAGPTAAALPVREAPMHFEAPLADASPIGAAALNAWSSNWRER